MTTTVNRRDIRLKEGVIYRQEGLAFSVQKRTPISSEWTATLDGPLSTGEQVGMSRGGNTSAEALAALEGAIAESGWEIR